MKINHWCKLREIAGEHIIVNQGMQGVDLTKIISMNKSACFLFEQLQGKDFEIEDAAALLADKYGISAEKAAEDARKWIEALKKCKVIE